MGGIISTHITSHHPSFERYLPSYFTSELLTENDLNNCSNLWFYILNKHTPSPPLIPSSSSPLSPFRQQFSCCKSWFYFFLYKQTLLEIKQQIINQSFPIHSYLRLMLQTIPASLQQQRNHHKFKQKIEFLSKQINQLIIPFQFIIKFGNFLFLSISYINSNIEMIESWKKLFSSILIIFIPSFLQYSSSASSSSCFLAPTNLNDKINQEEEEEKEEEEEEDEFSELNLFSSNSPSPLISTERFYTSLENSIST